MSLTWKDAVTTVLAVIVAGLWYAKSNTIQLPLVSDGYRWAIVVLAVIGISMCAFSGADPNSAKGPFVMVASSLGILALIFIVYGLISGTQIAFILLTITILLLWLMSTVRHFFVR